MSTSLADLFATDSPPRQRPRSASPASNASTPRPARRSGGTALFLSPGGSEASPLKRRRFSFDDEVVPTLSPLRRRSPTPMDHDGLERISHSLNERSDRLGRLGILDDPFAIQDGMASGGPEEVVEKKRRVMAKVDAERLLGSKGIPALVQIAQRWKPKGKGQEVRDLDRILDVYQMWAHNMFPKGRFLYTVGRVEALARNRRVDAAIEGMRYAFHNPEDANGDGRDGSVAEDENGSRDPVNGEAPEPLFNHFDDEVDDNVAAMADMPQEPEDMDEIAAMEEMEREAAGRTETEAPSRPTDHATPPLQPDFGDEPPVFDEEEEW